MVLDIWETNMPRREVPFLPHIYYHFYNRGNNRQLIFFEPDNYLYFLKGIKKYIVPEVNIVAYCLMPTHYHILSRVKQPQTSEVSETLEVFFLPSAILPIFLALFPKALDPAF